MPQSSAEFLQSLFNLDGRVAVVTGGLGRIGTEFVAALAKSGANVAVFDVVSDVPAVLKELAKGYSVSFHKVDITQEASVQTALDEVKAKWGIPTILVNNAGWRASPSAGGQGGVPFEQYPMNIWEDVFRINTTAAAICSKLVGKMLIEAGKPGVIVNMLSVYAHVAPDQRIYKQPFVKDASYGASKAALLALTRDLAVQWAPHNIRVVAMSPGGVQHEKSDEQFVKNYSERVPLGRMVRVEDLSGALIFLVSDAASYITGTNIMIDGGMSIL